MPRLLVLAFVLILGSLQTALAERRLAFVAGINDYLNLPRERQLQRAVKDAETVGDALQALGFQVARMTRGVTQEGFLRRFGEFVRSIEPGDTAVFFFAGHGIALDGTNYLIPSDTPALSSGDERLVRSRSMAETDLISDIRERGARVTVMVIDACRDNPFPKAGTRSLGATRGLAVKEPAEGVFSIYSAGFGQEALDRLPGNDASPNSVFTRVFVEQLKKPGVNLVDLGESVRDEVAALAKRANHPQVPAVYNQILGARRVFLAGLAQSPPLTPPAPPPGPGPDEIAWSLIEGTGDARQIEGLRDRFPHSQLRPAWEARLAELQRQSAEALEAERLKREADQRAAAETKRRAEAELRAAEERSLAAERQAAEEAARLAEEGRRKAQVAMLPAPAAPIVERATGLEIRTLRGGIGAADVVAFSPDGRTLAATNGSHSITLWEVATGREIRTLAEHKWGINSFAFSPDGQVLASSGNHERTVKLWDAATGRAIRTLTGHKDHVGPVAFSPDGRTLASADDHTIKLWDGASGRGIRLLQDKYFATFAFSPDGRMLASGHLGNAVKLWDVATGRATKTLSGHEGAVRSVAFSPDGRILASGSWDQTIKLWDAAAGREMRTLSGHRLAIRSIAFSPDGRMLASAANTMFSSETAENTIKLWDVAAGREIRTLSGHTGEVRSLAFSPDGRTLASGGGDYTVKLWDVATSGAGIAGGGTR